MVKRWCLRNFWLWAVSPVYVWTQCRSIYQQRGMNFTGSWTSCTVWAIASVTNTLLVPGLARLIFVNMCRFIPLLLVDKFTVLWQIISLWYKLPSHQYTIHLPYDAIHNTLTIWWCMIKKWCVRVSSLSSRPCVWVDTVLWYCINLWHTFLVYNDINLWARIMNIGINVLHYSYSLNKDYACHKSCYIFV